jgi:hypothetical protein
MKDWFAACAVGLVIIVGSAAGLGGTLAFLLAFGLTWYLLTARDIGFAPARDALGIKLLPPVWRRSNWLWLDVLLDDGDKLLKAVTIALVVIGAAQMFRQDIVYGAAVLIAAFYVSEILRGKIAPRPRPVRIPDAGAKVAVIETAMIEITPNTAPLAATAQIALAVPHGSDPVRATAVGTALSPIFAPPIVASPVSRVIVARPRELRKPVVLKQRPVNRQSARKRANSAKRSRDKPKRTERSQPPLPGRKPDYPMAIRPRKPPRRQPMLRRRAAHKPAAQARRGAPKPAATVKR